MAKCVLVLLAFCLAAPAVAFESTSGFVEVLMIDTYEKACEPGDRVTYSWTLMNTAEGATLNVNVTGSMKGDGWLFAVVPGDVVIPADGFASVVAEVWAPASGGSDSSNLTLEMRVFQSGYLVQVTMIYAESHRDGELVDYGKVIGFFDNPLPPPLDNEWGVFLLDVVIWLVIAVVVASILTILRSLVAKRTTVMIDDIIIRIIRTPALLLILAYGAVTSLDALGDHISDSVRNSVDAVYQTILVIVIFYLIYKVFKEVLVYYGKVISKKTAWKADDVLVPVIEKIGLAAIGLAAVGYGLDAIGIDLTVFVAGGVVVSMVLAFAAQETISNFFSGVFILTDRPFKEGDMIILSDDDWYEVRRIGLRTTRLFRYKDATLVSIPNNQLANQKVANFTDVQDKGRITMTVGVAYGTDIEKVKRIILEVISSCKHIITDKKEMKPVVRFDNMAESSLDFFILVWIKDRSQRFDVKDYLNTQIYTRFNKEGIEIPFPQRVVYLRKEESEQESKRK